MKNIFISDLHLSPVRRDTVKLFLDFIHTYPTTGDSLYILGDLFDFWVGDDDDAPLANQVRTAFRAITERGVLLYIQQGNRDFFLGKRFMQATGAKLLPDCYCTLVAGQQTLLMHGDLLCTDDIDYQKSRRWLRKPFLLWLMLRQPLALRRKVSAHYRERSKQKTASMAADIMDANAGTVIRYMQQYQIRQLIHGHTHRPAVHQHALPDGQTGVRYVLDEWHPDHASAWVDDGTGLRKHQIKF